MAEHMQNIQRRIKSISSTERITNAMKLVSAAKLRKAKEVFENSRLYLGRLLESIQDTFADTADVPVEFLSGSREIKNKCYVLITSSNGLCGSFNGNVIRTMEEELAAYDGGREHVRLVTIGSKGKDYFLHHDVEIIQTHDAPADTVTFSETREISGPLIDMYLAGEIDEIDIVYTAYINTLRQEVTVKRLLPLEIPERKEEQKFNMPVEYVPSAAEVFGF